MIARRLHQNALAGILLVTALISTSAFAADEDNKSSTANSSSGVHPVDDAKKAAKAVGHGVKKTTTAIGHGFRDGARVIGHGTRKVTREIGHAFRDGAHKLEGKEE